MKQETHEAREAIFAKQKLLKMKYNKIRKNKCLDVIELIKVQKLLCRVAI